VKPRCIFGICVWRTDGNVRKVWDALLYRVLYPLYGSGNDRSFATFSE